MSLLRRAVRQGSRPWAVGTLFTATLIFLACAPAEEAGMEEGAEAGETAGDPMAARTAGEAPACRFTASGEELTGRASPPDSASVRLGDATAKLCYGAPSVRGREIMGGLVPFGQPWRMGANEPTTLHLPFPAEVGGVELEPGSYALYAIPGETEWTIVVNADPERWGVPIDDEVRARDLGSFTVRPERLEEPVERMRIGIQPPGDGTARIVLEWENTRVSFPLVRRAAEGGGSG